MIGAVAVHGRERSKSEKGEYPEDMVWVVRD